MTPLQLRSAREMLGLSAESLAQMADVSLSTITDYERETRKIPDPVRETIQVALEAAGVEFVNGCDDGPLVRLKRSGGV